MDLKDSHSVMNFFLINYNMRLRQGDSFFLSHYYCDTNNEESQFIIRTRIRQRFNNINEICTQALRV
jgi:hypothetical protein